MRASSLLVLLAVVGGLCAVGMAPAAAGAQEATNVSVTSASGAPGSNVTVALRARAKNVSSYEASLTYDPSVVKVVAVNGADFSKPITNIDGEAGRLNLTQVAVDGVDDPTFAQITFRIVGHPSNTSAVTVVPSATTVFDRNSEQIRIDAYDAGRVSVEAVSTETATAATTAPPDQNDSESTSTARSSGATVSTTAASAADANERSSDQSSILQGGLDGSFVLGAVFAVFVLVVAGGAYYLGARKSRSRTDW